MSGPKLLPGCMMPDGAEPCEAYQELYALYEAVVRERDEAWNSSANMLEEVKRISREREVLRRALDEAPHDPGCIRFVNIRLEIGRRIKKKCNCYKSRLPRAGG